MNYHYTAYTADKQVVEGTIEAASGENAEESLYQAGFKYILSLNVKPPPLTVDRLLPTFFGIKRQDIVDFSRQLAAFVGSGISLPTALQLLQDQATKPALRTIIADLAKELQGGRSFSQALSRHPEAFSYSYCQVVRASEQAGELERGLKQVSNNIERQMVVAGRIRRALTYPTLVILMSIAVFILLVTVVLPPMVLLFASFEVSLPWTTRAIIGFQDFLAHYKLHVLLAILVMILGLLGYSRLPGGRIMLDRLSLRAPVLGSIVIQRTMGQFCRTASMLIGAGLQLPQVMDVAIKTTSINQIVKQALVEVRERLVQGEGLSHPMSENSLFPRMMIKMVAVGEQTGTVDTVLATLADHYEAQADQRVQALISMIEPALTVVIGLGVAFLLISIVAPLYSILGSVS